MHKARKFISKRITILFTVSAVLIPSLALAHGNAVKGKALYGQQCVSCHGASGKGDGPVASGFNPKPRNLTDKKYMKELSDQHLFDVIKKGGAAVGKSPLMPGFGATLKDENIQDVVAFLRSMAK